ncbi:MAG: hypothetical protein H0V17_26605 [Deltaproteobacteria bacterium]|nr:hypothetical protein [Deltaproteobacteria bacterium]
MTAPQPAPPTDNRQTAQKLVNLSHILGWGGLGLLLVLGPVVLFGVNPTGGLVVMGIGFLSAFVGAILGQVGRGMQGRVI